MRPTRSALIASVFSACIFGACSQGGSPTGYAAEAELTAPKYANPGDPARAEEAVPGDPQGTVEPGAEDAARDTASSPAAEATGEAAPAATAAKDSAGDTPPAAKGPEASQDPAPTADTASSPAAEATGEAAPADLPAAEAPVPPAARPDSAPVSAEAAPAEPPKPASAVDSLLAIAAKAPEAATGDKAPEAVPSEASEAVAAGPGAVSESAVPVGPVSSLASAASAVPPASARFLNTDFEDQSVACWNGNRTAKSANRAGCGPFTAIGFAPFSLSETGIAHSGNKAIDITYAKNEEAGGTNVLVNSDSVNVRAYYYFEPGFDFGQGMKIGRVSSFNTAKQINDVDIILEIRSAQGGNQCGITEMRDIGLFFNGAPKGFDWGNATATMTLERGRWYAVEYQVVLNKPGRSDGAVRLWIDGVQVAARTGLSIRGTLEAAAKLNTVKIGGWYSNGANGNSACAHPAQPSKLHMDDVAIAAAYIGPMRSAIAANP